MRFLSIMAAVSAISLSKHTRQDGFEWTPVDDIYWDGEYRVDPPAQFSDPDTDVFMHNMYKTYASEGEKLNKETG